MKELILHAITVFMGFFAISNPLANAPVFLGLTQTVPAQTTRKIAQKALVIAFIIVATFCIAGKIIFDLFGITLDAFRITGGILVVFIGFEMLRGQASNVEQPDIEDVNQVQSTALNLAITPLAMPLIAGPGTIATAMNFSAGRGLDSSLITIAIYAGFCFLTYFVFINARRITANLGDDALNVISRMMGLLIAVIGTQMIISGSRGAFGL